jgi:hypothetical protein
MLTRRAFAQIALASAFALNGGQARPQPPVAVSNARRDEAAALRRFAETTHPRGLEAATTQEWQRRWSGLAEQADALSDGAYFLALRRALGWFVDGHTTILPFEFIGGIPSALHSGPFRLDLPFRVRLFHDGAYVTSATPQFSDVLGSRVDRIGGLAAAELVRRVGTDWPGNAAWAHRQAPATFSSPAFLNAFGAVGDAAAPIDIEMGGRTLRMTPSTTPSGTLQPLARQRTEREQWAEAAGGGNYVRVLPERRAVFLSIDEMGDTNARSFETLTREAFDAMTAEGTERLVIDLRRNGGGDNYLGEALRKRIASTRFNRAGGLYLLIGPATFSAAQNLANRLERETFALFVGEPTGGAPNHYGDAQLFTGEATGISAIVSSLPWFDSYPQDRRPWIMPDLPVPATFADWAAGRDPTLESAFSHQNPASGDELDRSRIYYFARPSQQAEWQPFWRESGSGAA